MLEIVDWVSIRARLHKLPDALKDHLRLRPRGDRQMLEVGAFYAQQPAARTPRVLSMRT